MSNVLEKEMEVKQRKMERRNFMGYLISVCLSASVNKQK